MRWGVLGGVCVTVACARADEPAVRSDPAGKASAVAPPIETAPAPTPTPSLAPPWSKHTAAVKSALGAVAYKTCSTGHVRPGKVTVTIAPSGKVTAVRVTSGTFAPAVIACVERAFRRVTVPPFPGPDPMTFAWSIEV